MDDALQARFQSYKATGDKGELNQLVSDLHPTIQGYIGVSGIAPSPLVVNEAKLLTAKAIQSYDPSHGASLQTWVKQGLRPLARFRQQKLRPVAPSERLQLEAVNLREQEMLFKEKHGYDPDTFELSEFANIPPKRIRQIRRGHSVGTEARAVDSFGNPTALQSPIVQSSADPMEEAVDLLMPTLGKLDRRIWELKTGYGGLDPMPHAEIAKTLGLSPATLTRRAARLALKVREAADILSEQ